MAVRMTWKIYGRDGHRQRESFSPSYANDFSWDGNIRLIEARNSDITGTNDYSIVSITRATEALCKRELSGQISDGIFENSSVGKRELIEKVVFLTLEEALKKEGAK